MSAQELSNNRTAVTLLCAAFVAVESYFLYSILGSIIPQFWLSNVVVHIVSAFAAYLIIDAIVRGSSAGKRKKVIVGVVVLAVTIIAAIALSVIVLYLNRLQLQSTLN
jgi:hypothetical protein